MEYWTIVLSILAGVLATYYYSSRKDSNVFRQHGIPHIKENSMLENIWKTFIRPKTFADIITEIYNVHSDAKYVGSFDFTRSVVLTIRDLELVKSITIKNFDAFQDHLFFGDEIQDPFFGTNLFVLRGDKWRDIRTLLSPAYTASKMKAMFPLIVECAVNFSEYLTNVPSNKRVMEIKDIFTRYTNDVIATCAFGINVDSMRNPDNDFYVYGKKATDLGVISLIKILMYQHVPSLVRLFNLKVIEGKKITRPDIIQLLRDSRGKRGPGRELTILDMTSQAFIFFLAGFESSST